VELLILEWISFILGNGRIGYTTNGRVVVIFELIVTISLLVQVTQVDGFLKITSLLNATFPSDTSDDSKPVKLV